MSFGGLFISTSGMLAAQVGLDVTSNNIANTNTEGYSRKTVNFQEGSSAKASAGSKLRLLSGVLIDQIERIRDSFLDQQVRQQNSNLGRDEVISDLTVQMNNILGEPSASGITAKLNQFFQAASDLAATPELETAKTVFLNSAVALTESFRQIDNSVSTLQGNLTAKPSGELPITINELNEKLDFLAQVHAEILAVQGKGESAAELEDRRDLLLDEVSNLLDVTIVKSGNGQFSKLTMNVNSSEALVEATIGFPNIDSTIAGLTAGSNSLVLTVNNGNGTSTGPFTVNFEAGSTIRQVVEKINDTFKAAGGKGSIASLNSSSQLVLQTSTVENATNNSTAGITIGAIGTSTANTVLGLTAGTTNGTNASTVNLLDSRGLLYTFDVEPGYAEVGVNPSKLILKANDATEAVLGYIDSPSGRVGGLLTMTNSEIPEMRASLTDFAMNIKDAINKIAVLGKTESGNAGAELFTGTTASNFAVNSNILANNSLFAQGKTGAVSDGAIATEIADLFFGTSAIISDGSQSEKVYLDSTNTGTVRSAIPVIPGETITIHADGIIDNNGSAMNAGTNSVSASDSLVQIEFINASGTVIGTAIDFPASVGAPEERVTYSGTIPAGAAFVRFKMNTTVDGTLSDNEGHFGISIIQGVENDSANNFNNKISNIVGDFGTRGSVAIAKVENANGLYTSLNNRRQSISGVSIEEEAANLIRFQNSFAANARVISVWDSVFQSIINMI